MAIDTHHFGTFHITAGADAEARRAPAAPAPQAVHDGVPLGWIDENTLRAMQDTPKSEKTRWPIYNLSEYASKEGMIPVYATAPAHPAEAVPAQGMDAIRELIAQHGKELEHNHYAYFELAYTRQTGWMAWITDHPRSMPPTEVVNPDRKVLACGQGDTPEAACAEALAAQAKQEKP